MPNGEHLTSDQFRKLEAPLKERDAIFDQVAREADATVVRNYHDQPSRRLRASTVDGIELLLHVSPVSGPSRPYYHLVAFAWVDGEGERWLWSRDVSRDLSVSSADDLLRALREGWELLHSLDNKQLRAEGKRVPLSNRGPR